MLSVSLACLHNAISQLYEFLSCQASSGASDLKEGKLWAHSMSTSTKESYFILFCRKTNVDDCLKTKREGILIVGLGKIIKGMQIT